jgi:hypothetical protein
MHAAKRKTREIPKAELHDRILKPYTEKRCAVCDEVKPLGEFNKTPYTTDQYSVQCRACAPKVTVTVREDIEFDLFASYESKQKLWDFYFEEVSCRGCGKRPVYAFHRELRKHIALKTMPWATSRQMLDGLDECDLLCQRCFRKAGAQLPYGQYRLNAAIARGEAVARAWGKWLIWQFIDRTS